jgi:hypothetical protein
VEGLSQQAGAELGHSRQSARTIEAKLRKRLVNHLRAEGWLDGGPGKLALGALKTAALALLVHFFR